MLRLSSLSRPQGVPHRLFVDLQELSDAVGAGGHCASEGSSFWAVQNSGGFPFPMVLSGGRPSDILGSVAGSEQIQKFQDSLCGGLGVGSQFPGRHIAVVEVDVEPFCRTEA